MTLLVWAHVVLIFAVASYVIRDPLADESDRRDLEHRFKSVMNWYVIVALRSIGAAAMPGFFFAALFFQS